jgi:hypothetical protein
MTGSSYKENNYRRKQITEQYLEKISNEELRKLFLEIRSIINKNRRNKKGNRNKEIEMCYIQRELQNRKEFGGNKK